MNIGYLNLLTASNRSTSLTITLLLAPQTSVCCAAQLLRPRWYFRLANSAVAERCQHVIQALGHDLEVGVDLRRPLVHKVDIAPGRIGICDPALSDFSPATRNYGRDLHLVRAKQRIHRLQHAQFDALKPLLDGPRRAQAIGDGGPGLGGGLLGCECLEGWDARRGQHPLAWLLEVIAPRECLPLVSKRVISAQLSPESNRLRRKVAVSCYRETNVSVHR